MFRFTYSLCFFWYVIWLISILRVAKCLHKLQQEEVWNILFYFVCFFTVTATVFAVGAAFFSGNFYLRHQAKHFKSVAVSYWVYYTNTTNN